MITRLLAVGAGGFLGAIARYAMTMWVLTWWRRDFPLGTFLVNISGCFVLGLFVTLAASRTSDLARLAIATGFVGAYTTFSTFEYETHQLPAALALANVLFSVVAGYLAVKLGVVLAK
ncbi:MAG TPA: fluoride efflux transporter CrcB [Thermoanaerobaculia bacterium]|jgi:CrcB protein